MFPKSIVFALSLTVSLACAPLSALAESPIKTAELSARLFEVGLEAGDPLLILAAAKLRKTLNLTLTQRAPTADSPVPEDIATAPVSWQDMLDTAAELAPGDDQIAALIGDIRAENTKGVSTGQVYSITAIRAGGTDTYPPLPYTGGEYAEVYVEGNDGTDLNLYVSDTKGRLVCSDTDISAIAYCGWRPAQSGGFTIEVKNRGRAASSYSLITN
ncbi:hypothetical protein [Thalassovita taeanensis]|uniref:Uncharacterized protein n=1 Tax=Thalassovita taeanensis TaxID=657014 RepID=A0A1H9AGP4_9RHOB|nr:hypothetical protein [Thalassovita taeanensis]SEP75914.1 hypothetical protein SAMN04488092_102134 [Thalassovita taeanensis]